MPSMMDVGVPSRQEGRGQIGAHVPGFAQIFDAVLALPGSDLVKADAAQALLRRAQQLKAGFGVAGPEQTRRCGVFRQALCFQQTTHQQKDDRSVRRQRGQGSLRETPDVHARAARREHARAGTQNARLAEDADIVLILKKDAFRVFERLPVKKDAQTVDAFLEQAVGLKGVAQTGDGGVDVRHARAARGQAAVDDRFDG